MKKFILFALMLFTVSCTINYSKNNYTVTVKLEGKDPVSISINNDGSGKKDFESKIALLGRSPQPIGTEILISNLKHADHKISFNVKVTKVQIIDNYGKVRTKSVEDFFVAHNNTTWYKNDGTSKLIPYTVQVSNHH